jgi:hypothetical protein
LAELCRAQLARRRDTHVHIRGWLVVALALAGSGGEAIDSADGLIEAAEATGNPLFLSMALWAYGVAFRHADPVGALHAVGRGLVIAQASGNRTYASVLALVLARLEAEHGDPVAAFDHLTLAIRNYHNAGNAMMIRVPLAILAVLFDRLGRYEPAATVAGFALSPMAAAGLPEISTAITHLRDVLGEVTYESLARKGETMTTAAMVTYATTKSTRPEQHSNTPAETRRREPACSRGGPATRPRGSPPHLNRLQQTTTAPTARARPAGRNLSHAHARAEYTSLLSAAKHHARPTS